MDLAALIIGAISALVAAAVAYFGVLAAGRFWNFHLSPYLAAAGGALVGMLGTAAILGGLFSSIAGLTDTKVAVDEVLPYMPLIKANEPTLYERIETSIIRDQEDGIGTDAVRANAKA